MASYYVLADAILGAATIRQITQVDHKTGQEHRKAMISGGVAISQVSGKASVEVSSFTTADLAGLLALNSNTIISAGYAVASGTVTLPFKKRASGATFTSGSSHPALTGTDALIVITSIEATQDGDMATAQCDLHWLSTDGLTKGCDDATGAALGAQSFNAEFALGPAYINGTLIAGVQSVRINPGIEVVKPPLGSGSIFPTFASIKSVTPTLELTVNDFDAIAATVGDFTAMTSANVYLRRRADAGVYSAGTDHARFTFAAGLTDTGSVSLSENNDGSGTITLHGKTLTTSVAVAIP